MHRNSSLRHSSDRTRLLATLGAVAFASGLVTSVLAPGVDLATTLEGLTGSNNQEVVGDVVSTTRPVEVMTVVYAESAGDTGMDANWHIRTWNTGSAEVTDEFLGTRPWGRMSPLGSAQYPSRYGVYRGGAGDLVLFQADSSVETGISVGPLGHSGSPIAFGGSGGNFFVGEGLTVLEISAEGVVISSREVAPAIAGERTVNGVPSKGPSVGLGEVSAITLGPDGTVYAFASNGVNGALQNLSDGRRLDLKGFGTVVDAVVASDGTLYSILHDESKTGNTFTLAIINLATMSLVGAVDTGITPGNGSIEGSVNGLQILITQSGDVFIFANESIDGATQKTILRHLNANGSLSDIPLPLNAGLQATVGVDGRLYTYGGLARGTIQVVDLKTGEVDLMESAAPKDAYIQAVFTK